MVFNIYYINLAKVYEIKMMLDNRILSNQEVENSKEISEEIAGKGKATLDIFKIFKLGEIGVEGKLDRSGSKKVLETFEVKTTKSTLLKEVIENAKIPRAIQGCSILK